MSVYSQWYCSDVDSWIPHSNQSWGRPEGARIGISKDLASTSAITINNTMTIPMLEYPTHQDLQKELGIRSLLLDFSWQSSQRRNLYRQFKTHGRRRAHGRRRRHCHPAARLRRRCAGPRALSLSPSLIHPLSPSLSVSRAALPASGRGSRWPDRRDIKKEKSFPRSRPIFRATSSAQSQKQKSFFLWGADLKTASLALRSGAEGAG